MFIKVKAFPQSREQKIIEKEENFFEIYVREKPIQNQANQAVLKVLAEYFNIPKDNIKLVKGFQERNKIFLIKNYD
ncbi:MAG TPA: DUF167 domain-containing protein [Candidatus Pacearchaeota archaeon]|nr:DUF167 domain-containing protein [Candidatus Pacearchaeota archaeon]HRR94819.1 DUF167 domain-containing protein [Candidatus Paceibacterota bacterium]HPC30577.1 DUF167 domain-containing protein [Candidatus Pacearchaeota archaeon]HQG09321.1 DUF167 domain-containing protein [Candidatus Pacearchaeota archaeon]HQH20205.1 DUF167 domain-containing protein [Candidatus Pacearchaeota archaeon]